MNPVSPHFTPIDLSPYCNARRDELPDSLRVPSPLAGIEGRTAFGGIPFRLSEGEGPGAILLDTEAVTVDLGGCAGNVCRLFARGGRPRHQLSGRFRRLCDGRQPAGGPGFVVYLRLRWPGPARNTDPAALRHPADAEYLGGEAHSKPCQSKRRWPSARQPRRYSWGACRATTTGAARRARVQGASRWKRRCGSTPWRIHIPTDRSNA